MQVASRRLILQCEICNVLFISLFLRANTAQQCTPCALKSQTRGIFFYSTKAAKEDSQDTYTASPGIGISGRGTDVWQPNDLGDARRASTRKPRPRITMAAGRLRERGIMQPASSLRRHARHFSSLAQRVLREPLRKKRGKRYRVLAENGR